MQFYTTKLGRSEGNLRVCIKAQDMLIPIRASLLKSAWFHDALETGGGPYGKKLEAIYHPEGKMLLPPLSSSTNDKALTQVLKAVAKKQEARPGWEGRYEGVSHGLQPPQ